jgi:hypothetical protein
LFRAMAFQHHHTMENEEGNSSLFPIIPAAKVEYYVDVETQREKVNDHDAGSLQPQENHDGMTISHMVQPVEQNIEGGNEASGKLIDTPVQNIDEASCADSEEGRWSSEDGMSGIDGSDFPKENEFSEKETKDVVHLKMLVFFILVTSASTLAAYAYVYIVRSETSQFESKFSNDASKILQAIGSSLDRTLGELDSLAVNMVSYAQAVNLTWPKVTYPNFGVKMAKTLPLTDAFLIAELHIVYPEKRKEWEEYSILHDDWVNQSMAIQETWNGYYGPIIYDWEPRGTIHAIPDDIEANVRYA